MQPRQARHQETICVTVDPAPTLSGLRVFGIGGVCLLKVVAGPERKHVSTVSVLKTHAQPPTKKDDRTCVCVLADAASHLE